MTKLQVVFYGLNNKGNDLRLGTVTLVDGVLVPSFLPESMLHDRDILGTVIHNPNPYGQPIDSKSQPEKWLRSLYLHYKSAYLRAGKAEATEDRTRAIENTEPFFATCGRDAKGRCMSADEPGGGAGPGKKRLVLPLTPARVKELKRLRDERANTVIPDSVRLPEILYLSMPGHTADKALQQGHSGEIKGLMGHEENRRDSVYLATHRGITDHYSSMYEGSKVLAVRLSRLDRTRLYYDANEPPNVEGHEPFGDSNPGYVVYRGRIPKQALFLTTD